MILAIPRRMKMMNNKAAKLQKNDLPGLARNLSQLIKDRKTSEAEVALALGLPVLTVRRLSSGETTDPHISTLKQLAVHFDISIDALIDPQSTAAVQHMRTLTKPQFIPILDWQTAADMQNVHALDLSAWKDWHALLPAVSQPISDFAFILKSKPSMHPRFPMGTLFAIDPCASPLDGDLVVVKMLHDGTLSLREICIDPPRWQLKPTITGSDTLFFDPALHQIIGPVVLSMLYARED